MNRREFVLASTASLGAVPLLGGAQDGTTVAGAGSFASNSISDTRTGWTIGGGVEQAFATNWSWKLEYNYLDFGSQNYSFTTTVAGVTSTAVNDLEEKVHVVKFGLNYRFR